MTETIKVEVDEALARRFRKRAMEIYGYKKGAMKRALEETIRKFAMPGKADWSALKGALKKPGVDAVELQHTLWAEPD